MGTRGCYGFVVNGEEKLAYNHFDSYPSCLGDNMITFLRETPLDEVREIAERIVLVEEQSEPTDDQITTCNTLGFTDLKVSTQSATDWYCLLRQIQGELNPYKDEQFVWMIDSHEFLTCSLFCEWAYIINLDTGKLEVYRGFNKNPDAMGRYAKFKGDGKEFYGVALMTEIPLAAFEGMSQGNATKLCELWEKLSTNLDPNLYDRNEALVELGIAPDIGY